jgi:hypothetical protein
MKHYVLSFALLAGCTTVQQFPVIAPEVVSMPLGMTSEEKELEELLEEGFEYYVCSDSERTFEKYRYGSGWMLTLHDSKEEYLLDYQGRLRMFRIKGSTVDAYNPFDEGVRQSEEYIDAVQKVVDELTEINR